MKKNKSPPMTGLSSFTFISNHAIVSLLILFHLSPSINAQSVPPGSGNSYQLNRVSPSMAIIIVVLVAAIFFMGFFSIYIRHWSDNSSGTRSNSVRGVLSIRSRRAAASLGLDPAVIQTFPTFAYSVVKGRKIGKGALECAVCLNEFEDDETLRLIPKCDHVFHPECIDAWLSSHVTCPVCRANLVQEPGESILPLSVQENPEIIDTENQETYIAANGNISSTSLSHDQEVHERVKRSSSLNQNRLNRTWSLRPPRVLGKFRSHSTGHSLDQSGENMDRFTLRLPVEVRKEIMNRAFLNRTTSCVVVLPRERSSRRGYRTGEWNSSRNKSFKRLEISNRWVFSTAPPFFSRAASVRFPKVVGDIGESSTSSRSPNGVLIKNQSHNCLEPSGDEAVLISYDSARPPV